jgi:hypothetical protein
MGEKRPRNFAESGDFHVTFGYPLGLYESKSMARLSVEITAGKQKGKILR